MVKEEIARRLGLRNDELKTRKENFMIMCQNEINTSNFERNAINDLMIMMQLKSEIKELEHLKMISENCK